MNTEFITFSIFLMGIVTVFVSTFSGLLFYKQANLLTNGARIISFAIAWQLFGEAVIGLGTLIFAKAAHFGWLPFWPQELQSFIRFAMFSATSITTIHLLFKIKSL